MTDAPLTLRPCRPADLDAVVSVMNAWDVAQTGEPDTIAEDVEEQWSASGFSLERDARVAETATGDVVGYVDVRDATERRGEREVMLFVHPEHDATPAGSVLLDFAVAQANGLELTTWSPGSGPTRDLLDAAGFQRERLFFRMRADIDRGDGAGTRVPPGIRLAPFHPGIDDQIVHAALLDAFAHHVRGIPVTLEAFAERHFRHPDFDPALWTVAWDGDEVAGVALVFDHGDLAFVRDLGVRGPWRGRGLGLALLEHTFALLRERGQTRVDLGVDAEDPVGAVRLYERAGFRVLQQLDLMRRPASLQ